MPSTSVKQQRAMGMAYALRKGKLDPDKVSDSVKNISKSMTLKQLKDFASTSHKDLKKSAMQYNVSSLLSQLLKKYNKDKLDVKTKSEEWKNTKQAAAGLKALSTLPKLLPAKYLSRFKNLFAGSKPAVNAVKNTTTQSAPAASLFSKMLQGTKETYKNLNPLYRQAWKGVNPFSKEFYKLDIPTPKFVLKHPFQTVLNAPLLYEGYGEVKDKIKDKDYTGALMSAATAATLLKSKGSLKTFIPFYSATTTRDMIIHPEKYLYPDEYSDDYTKAILEQEAYNDAMNRINKVKTDNPNLLRRPATLNYSRDWTGNSEAYNPNARF